jgi:hypothetical protein
MPKKIRRKTMTRKELYEWLNTCPSHKWETPHESEEYVSVDFKIDIEEEDDE